MHYSTAQQINKRTEDVSSLIERGKARKKTKKYLTPAHERRIEEKKKQFDLLEERMPARICHLEYTLKQFLANTMGSKGGIYVGYSQFKK